MNRRSFLTSIVFGVGALSAGTIAKLDAFAISSGLKTGPFPVWNVKWKIAGKTGWAYKSKMNVIEGFTPRQEARFNGITFDLYKLNPVTQEAWYYKRAS